MHHIHIPTEDLARLDHWLHHPHAVADLAAMGEALVEGARVVLQTPAGAERAARLHFQAEVNCWIAYPT